MRAQHPRALEIGFGPDLKTPRRSTTLRSLCWQRACTPVALVPSRLGRAVLAIRDDEQRAEALGATFKLRWLVFVVAGMVAVSPAHCRPINRLRQPQRAALDADVDGDGDPRRRGLGSGVIGAAALLLQEVLSAYTPLGVLDRLGVVGRRALRTSGAGWPDSPGIRAPMNAVPSAPLLHVHQLRKRFGGVIASDGIDLQVRSGEVHALIGPNGAGKTTLVAQLAGQLAPDAGRIVFDGVDITAWSAHQRARSGLARSFQITRLFKSFTVLEHLALALQAASGRVGRMAPLSRDRSLWQARASSCRHSVWRACRCAVDTLSHGQRRALEVGMAVAAARGWSSMSRWPAWGPTNPREWKRLIELARHDGALDRA
jgi:ABC-type lipoprotein export system ATPase subunit